jgi:hypothetical protein
MHSGSMFLDQAENCLYFSNSECEGYHRLCGTQKASSMLFHVDEAVVVGLMPLTMM